MSLKVRQLRFTFLTVVVIALVLFGRQLSTVFIEALWFESLGQYQTFLTRLISPWLFGLSSGLLAGVFVYLNLQAARPSLDFLPYNVFPLEIRRWLSKRSVNRIFLLFSGLIALMFGASIGRNWLVIRLWFESRPFHDLADPLFGQNPSFYIFVLPSIQLFLQFATLLTLLTLLVVMLLYFVGGDFRQVGSQIHVGSKARRHLAILGSLFFVVKAVDYFFTRYHLVFNQQESFYGAGYTDVHLRLPTLTLLMLLALFTAAMIASLYRSLQTRWLIISLGALLVVSAVGGTVLPGFVQQLVVKPNELQLERTYIQNNIDMTLSAWNLGEVQEVRFPAEEELTYADIENNLGTIENVRIWDWRVLQSSYQQLQAIRPYYRFYEMDVDRYTIGNDLRQVILSAREIAYDQLPSTSNTWINRHMKYTHGLGVVVTPAAEVTENGLPPFWIGDIPPNARVPLQVERPEIYYGEKTDIYALVGTDETEFGYAANDGAMGYQGTGGIGIGGWLPRIAFSWYTGDINLLLSRSINRDTKALIHRSIGTRIQKLAPFLIYDADPYLVIADGRLFWIQDAYTATGRFPYSTPDPATGLNYMRNSVKVVVDAYHGTVDFYVTDPQDPLIQAYRAIFPALFRDVEQAPAVIREHFRYPETLFTAQLQIYAQYHMNRADEFYNRPDLWERPRELFAEQAQWVEPYYVLAQLPGMAEPGFMLMSPMTPYGTPENPRDNMIAWISGEADSLGRNSLRVYRMPEDKTVYGPMQIESRINQDAEISEQLNLWNQQGSQVVRGNLLVIPLADSLLYVEPVYLQSTSARLPELRRVIVTYGNQSPVMAPTLQEALDVLFGRQPEPNPETQPNDGAEGPAGSSPDDWKTAISRAERMFEEAQAALREGDWAGYGERMQELGELIKRLAGQE